MEDKKLGRPCAEDVLRVLRLYPDTLWEVAQKINRKLVTPWKRQVSWASDELVFWRRTTPDGGLFMATIERVERDGKVRWNWSCQDHTSHSPTLQQAKDRCDRLLQKNGFYLPSDEVA